MNIKINNQTKEVNSDNLAAVLESVGVPAAGVAVAVNSKMVPRTEWDAFTLTENDEILVIRAACGG